MRDPVDEMTALVIREHALTGPLPGECRCGWGLDTAHAGQWHSLHVVEELRKVGVLRSTCD